MNHSCIVKVLGTAQDGGIPHANCQCKHCRGVVENRNPQRYPAALGLIIPEKKKWFLVDATPQMCEQIRLMRKNYPELDLMSSILLTHAHVGHYTGLMFLGKEIISTQNIPVYCGALMNNVLSNNVPWKQLVELNNIDTKRINSNQTFKLDSGLLVTPLDVPHRNEYSETFGFIFTGPSKSLLYIPDIDRWSMWEEDLERVASTVDYCLLDGTFYSAEELRNYGRNYEEIPHPLVNETMDLLQRIVDKQRTKVYFTHLNHTNPLSDSTHETQKIIQNRGFSVASEGMEFLL